MSSSSGIKSFITETEVEEVRQKRQEEWEKVRKPDDPIERPEAEIDNRTLYDKLQEQKDKKQEEWEEQHKFKNMIRGLEDDETEFLDLVAKQQQEVNKRRFDEENREVKSFRSAALELDNSTVVNTKPTPKRTAQAAGKKSQMDLIAGGIKRRKSSSSSDTAITPEKKPKTQAEINETASKFNETSQQNSPVTNDRPLSSDEEHELKKVLVPRYRVERFGSNLRQSQSIPGMGIYSDSSDSESSSSDSEIISTSSFVRYQQH